MSTQPGGIKIENVQLLGSEGAQFIDISEIFLEFSIYENMHSPFMKCDILVKESLSLITKIPIVGNEMIKVKFAVPVEEMEDKPFERIFRILSIEDLSIGRSVRDASYIIKCYDPEYFYDAATQFSEGFEDNAQKIVEKIWTTYLKGDNAKLKTTDCNRLNVVIPYTSPFNAISIVSQLSESTEYPEYSSHVFYASKNGPFNFTSVQALCDKTKKPSDYIIDKYSLKEKNLSKTEIKDDETSKSKKPDEWLRINNFKIVNRMDLRDMINDGAIGNTTWYVNPSVKLYDKTEYNYVKDFEKLQKLAKSTGYPVVNNEKNELEFSSVNYYVPTNYGENISSDAYNKRYKFLGPGIGFKRALNAVVLDVTIPGDNTRVVGDLIELQIPEYGGTDDSIGEVDAYISGLYLVTAVRHLYNIETGYSTILRCNKNVFESSISDTVAKNFDGLKGTTQETPKVQENKAEVHSADI